MYTFLSQTTNAISTLICSMVPHQFDQYCKIPPVAMLSASGSQQLCCPDPLPKARTENRAGNMNISKGTFAKCVSPASTPNQQISTYPHPWHPGSRRDLFPKFCPKSRQGLKSQPRSRQGLPLRQLRGPRWPQAPCLHQRHHHHLSYHHLASTWLTLVSILEQHSLDIQTTVSCQDLQLRGSYFVSLDKSSYRCNRQLTTSTEKSK